MIGLRTALLFLAFWLLLGAMGQGIENYRDMQSGFQRELPQVVCSPITGRTLPVPSWWAEYDDYHDNVKTREDLVED